MSRYIPFIFAFLLSVFSVCGVETRAAESVKLCQSYELWEEWDALKGGDTEKYERLKAEHNRTARTVGVPPEEAKAETERIRRQEQQEKTRKEREQQEKTRKEQERQEEARKVQEQQEKARKVQEQQEEARKVREQQEKERKEREQQEEERKEREQQEGERKAGDLLRWTINDVKFRFHYCPAGTFMMGSPAEETGRHGNETPHQIMLTQGFWMGETEVTQEQWESIMGDNPSKFKGAKLPVECVSWDDCQDFVKKLNALGTAPKGYTFALPTEAQWEYACRAGSTTAYCFGDDVYLLDAYCWDSDNSDEKTHKVGIKKANVWGLYDMHGNVWEWCSDWYGQYPRPTASASKRIDPVGASFGTIRVSRGGSWYYELEHCRSAFRYYCTPDFDNADWGVRVALVSDE
ncbi:MAG: SUMF1/EgtB/PvdO family nonheme iron enzyme [Planctomycetaceae bacterium]|jgi:formylglycine-generating enzyme required for sulfatase activity|nr:SUMF1/EgtB/PvdO family nonheme iron enzyme [Planctomycetaceae bacterium]